MLRSSVLLALLTELRCDDDNVGLSGLVLLLRSRHVVNLGSGALLRVLVQMSDVVLDLVGDNARLSWLGSGDVNDLDLRLLRARSVPVTMSVMATMATVGVGTGTRSHAMVVVMVVVTVTVAIAVTVILEMNDSRLNGAGLLLLVMVVMVVFFLNFVMDDTAANLRLVGLGLIVVVVVWLLVVVVVGLVGLLVVGLLVRLLVGLHVGRDVGLLDRRDVGLSGRTVVEWLLSFLGEDLGKNGFSLNVKVLVRVMAVGVVEWVITIDAAFLLVESSVGYAVAESVDLWGAGAIGNAVSKSITHLVNVEANAVTKSIVVRIELILGVG